MTLDKVKENIDSITYDFFIGKFDAVSAIFRIWNAANRFLDGIVTDAEYGECEDYAGKAQGVIDLQISEEIRSTKPTNPEL